MKKYFVFALLISALMMSSCAAATRKVVWVGIQLPGSMEATYLLFDGRDTARFKAETGKTLALDYEVEIEQGALTLQVLSPDGANVWETVLESDAKNQVRLKLKGSGRYTLRVIGEETAGGFDIHWKLQ